MLDHSTMLHDVAEGRDSVRFEEATDNLSNSLETFIEWRKVCF